MTLANDILLEMQRRMLRIRYFDERASKMVKRGDIPGTVHTSIGQEAQVVGAGAHHRYLWKVLFRAVCGQRSGFSL